MDMTLMGRNAVRALAVVLLAGTAAIGLAACQTSTNAPAGPDTEIDRRMVVNDELAQKFEEQSLRYGGRPADRIEEQIRRDTPRRLEPLDGCNRHIVVEHPDGGFHAVCVQSANG